MHRRPVHKLLLLLLLLLLLRLRLLRLRLRLLRLRLRLRLLVLLLLLLERLLLRLVRIPPTVSIAHVRRSRGRASP